jgi:hypothetical protein
MFVPFEKLSPESRVWVYQGSRAFTKDEATYLASALHAFCEQWSAHGEPLKSSFRIESNQFVIMAVDEDFHNPSGCSIDSSVSVLRQIHQATGIDLLDRTSVAFEIQGQTVLVPITQLKQQFQDGILKPESITFNTLITTKQDWTTRWKLPAQKTWLAKYLPKPALTA